MIRRWIFNIAAIVSMLLCAAMVRTYIFLSAQPDFDWLIFDRKLAIYRAATRSEVRWMKQSPLLMAGAVAVLPLTWTFVKGRHWIVQRKRMRTDSCPACGYNLTGNTSGVCPECGKLIEHGSS